MLAQTHAACFPLKFTSQTGVLNTVDMQLSQLSHMQLSQKNTLLNPILDLNKNI